MRVPCFDIKLATMSAEMISAMEHVKETFKCENNHYGFFYDDVMTVRIGFKIKARVDCKHMAVDNKLYL